MPLVARLGVRLAFASATWYESASRFQASMRRGRIVLHASNQGARPFAEMHGLRHGIADLLRLDAYVTARDLAGLLELRHDRVDHVGRNGEPDSN